MTSNEFLKRLFALAQKLAHHEVNSAFSGIAQIRGTHSWGFLEHLNELPEKGKSEILQALIKRRFAIEGLRSSETVLSSTEELEIQHWLKHDNSMHGTRIAPFFARSVREEEFQQAKATFLSASKKDIQAVLREQLKCSNIPIQITRDNRNEMSWCATVSGLSIRETVDFGAKWGGFAEGLVVVHDASRPLNIPISFLRILGIGSTSWEFLAQGEEHLCASATLRFFTEICGVAS